MRKPKEKPQPTESFQRFEELTKNLLSVSNAEVREKMKEEKRNKKKSPKRKAS
jgi:hypothetical protein